MKKVTERRIIELSAAGAKPRAISRTIGCQLSTVMRVLGELPQLEEPEDEAAEPQEAEQPEDSDQPHPAKDKPDSIGAVVDLTREALFSESSALKDRLERVNRALDVMLPRDFDESDLGDFKPGQYHALSVTAAILVDKLREVTRQLRELESEASEGLEAVFTIVVEHENGRREVVGQPPELKGWIT